jgi:hypothetical protein
MPILIFSSCLTLLPEICCTAWAVQPLGALLFFLFHGRKEQILDLVELKIGIAVQRDQLVFLVQLDFGTGRLEVVTIVDSPLGDVYRVVQSRHIGFRRKIK